MPPGGRRTSLALAWIGQISTVVAVACSLAPNAGDPAPMLSVVKIVLSALVMLCCGLFLYWLADRRRKAKSARAVLEISLSPDCGGEGESR
jgi:amino acid transporter